MAGTGSQEDASSFDGDLLEICQAQITSAMRSQKTELACARSFGVAVVYVTELILTLFSFHSWAAEHLKADAPVVAVIWGP